MENKQNRDALLQEILRETASHKRPSEEIREEQAKPHHLGGAGTSDKPIVATNDDRTGTACVPEHCTAG